MISETGTRLSAGQRQRIGLARALYGNPVLLVLDEPNSNLDAEGETALVKSIELTRSRGATVIVVAHRPSALIALDQLMMLRDGQCLAFGPRDAVLNKVIAKPAPERAVFPWWHPATNYFSRKVREIWSVSGCRK